MAPLRRGQRRRVARSLAPALALAALALAALTGCSQESGGERMTIYSGRSEEFIAPFFESFSAETGIELDIRYGDSAALAAQILEEGKNSPADIFLSQDAGALGAVAEAGILMGLSESILSGVPTNFKSPDRDWVGVTGRVRVLAYSPNRTAELPTSVDELLDSQWRGRIGIAPTNSSFQAFVTAMIQSRGLQATENWLSGLVANKPKLFEKNSQIVEAIDSGNIDLGLVNHYYIWEVSEELGREINVKIAFFAPGDLGNLVNVSGVGILDSSSKQEIAEELVRFLLSSKIQERFVSETHEYSLTNPSLRPTDLPALSEISAPKVDLSELADLRQTQALLIKVGLI